MLRTSGLLAIAVGIATSGSFATPASALPGARTAVRPVQLPAGELPVPPLVPKVRQPYCATHNCIMPPRNFGGR